MDLSHEKDGVINLAGGCFWGTELLMQSMNGVIDVKSGYAKGTCREGANYKSVFTGKTGFRETVRVEYDSEKISLDAICSRTFTSSIRPSETGYTDESEWVTFENTHEAIDS